MLEWFTQICHGIKHFHDKGITINNISSQNIFLHGNGIDGKRTAKIGDYLVLDVSKSSDVLVGSVPYLAPEVFTIDELERGPYTDIWAAGCVLYEMCMKRKPFEAPSVAGITFKIVENDFEEIPDHLYSKELRDLV